MTDADFEVWLNDKKQALKAWGSFVVAKISERVEIDIGSERFEQFFKVAPSMRVKTTASALKKKQRYDDPTEKMTDLIGARFVVLLKTDIKIAEGAITSFGAWSPRRDRNPDEEYKDAPNSFDYQSVHYLIRNATEFTWENVIIPQGMTCEVQIRTLLQHAYSELTHDKIYKGPQKAPPSVQRLVARCMALMETTDDMFCAAVAELDRTRKTRISFSNHLDEIADKFLPTYIKTKDDEYAREILDTYWHLIESADLEKVQAEISQSVQSKIQRRASDNGLFAMPIVVAVYWLAKHHRFVLRTHWPNPELEADLVKILFDQGG